MLHVRVPAASGQPGQQDEDRGVGRELPFRYLGVERDRTAVRHRDHLPLVRHVRVGPEERGKDGLDVTVVQEHGKLVRLAQVRAEALDCIVPRILSG